MLAGAASQAACCARCSGERGARCRYALSGGRQTVEEHRRLGADLDVDVPVKWLRFFMEDDARLEEIKRAYSSGAMLTGEVKAELAVVLQALIGRHARARALVSDAVVDAFMAPRPMQHAWLP
jgi:tryptophanyl-tRNA synthetase